MENNKKNDLVKELWTQVYGKAVVTGSTHSHPLNSANLHMHSISGDVFCINFWDATLCVCL